jgi:hypothetical protein
MADDCYERLVSPEIYQKLFGDRKIPKEAIRRFVKDIEDMKVAADQGEFNFESRVNKYIKQKKEENQIAKALAANRLRLAQNRFKYYTQEGFKGNPTEGFIAKLTFSRLLANEARYSAENIAAELSHSMLNGLAGEMTQFSKKHWEIFDSGAIDLDIRTEIKNLSLEKPFSTDNKVAQEIAQAVHAVNRRMYNEHLNSGVPLRDLPGFTASTTHSPEKMHAVGKEAWVNRVHSLDLDRERIFGKDAGNVEKEKAMLGKMYENITKFKPSDKTNLNVAMEDGMGLSLTKKLTAARQLHFLSAEGEHTYNLEFGQGNLASNVVEGIKRKSKMLGLVKLFGDNPEKALMEDVNRVQQYLEAQGRTEEADQLKRNREHIRATFLAVTGATSQAGIDNFSKVNQIVRANNVLAMLTNTGVRSLSNFPTMAMQLSDMTGRNFFEMLGSGTKAWFDSLNADSRNAIAQAAGYWHHDVTEHVQAATFGDKITSVQGKVARLMFKLNGMDTINRGMKHAFAQLFMGEIAHNLDRSFPDLHPKLQASFLSAGIEAADFKLLAQGLEDIGDGRKLVTADGIKSIPLESVRERASQLKVSPERYLTDLRDRYLGLIHMGGNASSTTAGAREMGLLIGNTYRGEWEGEIRRHIGQFKTFWAQGYNLMQQGLNATPNPELLKSGVLASNTLEKGFKGASANVANWLVMSTAFGYLGQTLIDIGRGRNPRDPRAIETWMDAFAKGGASGMYGDILMPDYSWTGALESLAGPTIGQIGGPVMKMYGEAKKDMLEKGKFQKTVKNQATRLIRNNIWFNQAPIWGQALDALQFGVIQESLKKGSSLKKDLADKKEVRKGKRIDFAPLDVFK